MTRRHRARGRRRSGTTGGGSVRAWRSSAHSIAGIRAGIGLLLGPRGKVVDLEIDDPVRAEPILQRLFTAGLAETLGWRSARGEHRLFLWDRRLADLSRNPVVVLGDGAIGLRLGGEAKQVAAVCPPSIGTDGNPRRWNGVWRIAPLPGELIEELEGMGRAHESRPCASVPPRPPGMDRGERYARSALAREVETVRDAGPGMRNRLLNRAAFNLGQLVGSGSLSRSAVESELRDAAFSAGLHEREVESTLRSGLEAGLRNPRTPPPGDGGGNSEGSS